MDLLGCASYLLPGIGELTDIVWAPISAIIFLIMFGRRAAFGAVFNFAEEILPGTDFIPTFTIAWIWRKVSRPQGRPTLRQQEPVANAFNR